MIPLDGRGLVSRKADLDGPQDGLDWERGMVGHVLVPRPEWVLDDGYWVTESDMDLGWILS